MQGLGRRETEPIATGHKSRIALKNHRRTSSEVSFLLIVCVQYNTCTFLVNCNRDYDLGSIVRESTAAADVAALRCSSATSVRPHSTLLRLCTYCRFMLFFCTCCHFMVQSKLFVHEDTRISERVYKCCSAILWFNPVPSYGSRHMGFELGRVFFGGRCLAHHGERYSCGNR